MLYKYQYQLTGKISYLKDYIQLIDNHSQVYKFNHSAFTNLYGNENNLECEFIFKSNIELKSNMLDSRIMITSFKFNQKNPNKKSLFKYHYHIEAIYKGISERKINKKDKRKVIRLGQVTIYNMSTGKEQHYSKLFLPYSKCYPNIYRKFSFDMNTLSPINTQYFKHKETFSINNLKCL